MRASKRSPTNHSQVVGYMPKGRESFVLAEIKVMTLTGDMPGFFEGTGLQIDFNPADVMQGTFSLWLTLADAKALVAHIEAKVRYLHQPPARSG